MDNFFNLLKLVSFPIHKEGFKFILIFALVTVVLSLMNSTLGLIGLVLTLWCVFFFRDPNRIIPQEKGVLVSPADGRVTKIEYDVEAPTELGLSGKKFNKISVFLNVFDVHVNRVPIAGKVVKVNYNPGKFFSANLDEASAENERNSTVVETADKSQIIFVQIAGMVARRIISELKEGEEVTTGQRYGIIRFGSRVDIYLPENVEIKALVGQTMIGGESIIAKLK